MGSSKGLGRRAAACVLTVTITFSTVPPVAARDNILGTIVVSGTALSATSKTDWAPITGTRPLISGDRLKTGKDSSLLADFHNLGIVGIYENSEMSIVEQGADIAVEARAGKAAFYLAPKSRVKVTAGRATIAAGEHKAEGYVKFNADGAPELVVESDDVSVVLPGGVSKVFVRGQQVVLNETLSGVPAQVTIPDGRKAGAMEQAPEKRSKKIGGLSPLGWTAIGVLVAAGVGLGVGLSGGGGGGGDDSNGSE